MTTIEQKLASIRERAEEAERKSDRYSDLMALADSQADVAPMLAALEAVRRKAHHMTRYEHNDDYWGGVRVAADVILDVMDQELEAMSETQEEG